MQSMLAAEFVRVSKYTQSITALVYQHTFKLSQLDYTNISETYTQQLGHTATYLFMLF